MTPSPRTLTRHAVLGHGRPAFEAAVAGLLDWRMHRLAGVSIDGVEPELMVDPARPGVRVRVGLGPRSLSLGGVCVVETVSQEPDRVFMTYRTAPGHVEHGSQSFCVELGPNGEVRGTITSTSTPGHTALRIVPAVGRAAQRAIAGRYVRALRRLARP